MEFNRIKYVIFISVIVAVIVLVINLNSKTNNENVMKYIREGDIYFNHAMEKTDISFIEKAEQSYLKAINEDSKDAIGYYRLAYIKGIKQENKSAEELLRVGESLNNTLEDTLPNIYLNEIYEDILEFGKITMIISEKALEMGILVMMSVREDIDSTKGDIIDKRIEKIDNQIKEYEKKGDELYNKLTTNQYIENLESLCSIYKKMKGEPLGPEESEIDKILKPKIDKESINKIITEKKTHLEYEIEEENKKR